MKKLILSTVTAATIMAGLSIPVHAGTENYMDGSLHNKKYVISGECINVCEETKFIFSNFGTCFQGGIWSHCPVIIFPGANKPETGGDNVDNKPEVNVPEINTPDINETDNFVDNNQNTDIPEVSEQETGATENDASNTVIPDANEQETKVPETESTTTGNTGCNKPNWNRPNISIQIPNKPGTNEPETSVPETSRPNTNNSNTGNGGATTEKPSTPEQNTQQLTYAEQVVKLVNQERAKAGLKAVTLDKQIEAAALIRAKEIEISFSHTRPNGSSFSSVLKEQGISFRGAGENIAWGQTSPEAVMNAWMNSEGHRANILNPNFTKIGVGYYQNSAGRKFWTQLFTY